MSVVRPEFGPTLPELVGPRFRALPRGRRVAILVLAALVVLVLLYAIFKPQDATVRKRAVIVRTPVAYNFVYRRPFGRLPLQGAETARIGSRTQSFSVSPLNLPAYRGDAAGFLPLYAAQQEDAMAARYLGFLWRDDGRANINQQQGYEIVFQYRTRDDRTAYGRRIFLLPNVTARQGADIVVTAERSPAIVRADDVGHNGGLKTALRSFRFGTQRP